VFSEGKVRGTCPSVRPEGYAGRGLRFFPKCFDREDEGHLFLYGSRGKRRRRRTCVQPSLPFHKCWIGAKHERGSAPSLGRVGAPGYKHLCKKNEVGPCEPQCTVEWA